MRRELKYVIEHGEKNHKKTENDLANFCKRKWSSFSHRIRFRNVGKPRFFYTRHRIGGTVVAVQVVECRILGAVLEGARDLFNKLGGPGKQ